MSFSQTELELAILLASLVALAYAGLQTIFILREDEGTDRMKEIAAAIREGAVAFLRREYTAVFAVGAVVAVVILVAFYNAPSPSPPSWELAVGFILGAAGSALAGALGMFVSVRANVRTAARARGGSIASTMRYAFLGGSVTGLSVAGLALLELVAFYQWFGNDVLAMVGLLFGASLMSLFARVGGGIYTKGADVGADLVGKVEAGIPEDDPRNPAVIADNVGDNVGDCAGMAADLFETYVVTAVSAMLLAYLIPSVHTTFGVAVQIPILYPLLVCAWAIVATLVGIAAVRMRPGGSIMGALYQGLGVTTIVGVIGLYLLDYELMGGNWGIFAATVIGLVVMILIVVVTDYYTSASYGPVKRIAESAEAGAGPVVITGLSVGLESAWIPGLVIVAAALGAFEAVGSFGPGGFMAPDPSLGLYGIGLAAASMLAVTGMIIAIDSFGPITDNAGGIAEMANLPPEARAVTDPLDAVGNTTKAVTKGYAVGSAVLAALALFAAYTFALKDQLSASNAAGLTSDLAISNPLIVAGLVIGGILPFFFTSFLMNAVGVAAQSIVFEVRRQFKEIQGILEGTGKPEYGKCVDIVTVTALRQLAAPAAIAVITPVAVGFLLGPLAVAGLLLGVILTGFPLALTMTTGGGAWDNGKKYIEQGHHGGKHSDAHKAAVVGDTVGDATKDTAGPAINPLIKVVNTISILLVALIVAHTLIPI
jgi:K(+)-stimulated pyrophosphate-energized sodium pump